MTTAYEPNEWDAFWAEAGDVFNPAGPINELDLFAGRKKQIREVIDIVYQDSQHGIIYGERGVGKTSLAKLLPIFFYSSPRGVTSTHVFCDSSDNYSSVWRKTFKRMRTSEDKESSLPAGRLSDFLPEKVDPDDVITLLLDFAPSLRPIIVIDEFDRLRSDEDARLLAETVKTLADEHVNVTVIFVGVADSVNDLVRGHESALRALVQVPMPRMDRNELSELVEKRVLKLGMKISSQMIGKIVSMSQGLPYYAHLIGLWSVRAACEAKTKTIKKDNISDGINLCLQKSQQSIMRDFHTATSSTRKESLFREVLYACALTETDDLNYFTTAAVGRPLAQITGRPMKIASYTNHLEEFSTDKRGNVLEKAGSKRRFRYRFRDPLMQPYVTMHGVASKSITEAMLELAEPIRNPVRPIGF